MNLALTHASPLLSGRSPALPTSSPVHQQSRATFASLPAELVEQVAEELRTPQGCADVLRFRQVNTRTRDAIDRMWPDLNANESAKRMLENPPGPVTQLRSFVAPSNTASTARALQVKAELLRQNRRSESAIALVPSITKLDFGESPEETPGVRYRLLTEWRQFYISSIHAMQRLESLSIDNVDENESAIVALSLSPSLRVLHLDSAWMGVELDGLRPICPQMPPFLTSLSIVDHAISLTAWSEWLVNLPPTLDKLRIADAEGDPDNAGEASVAVSVLATQPCRATRLRTLEICSVTPGTSTPHLAYLLGAQTNLETLKFHSSTSLSQVSNILGGENLRSIVEADFSLRGDNVPTGFLKQYLVGCRKLTLEGFQLEKRDFLSLKQRTSPEPLTLTLQDRPLSHAELVEIDDMSTQDATGETRKLVKLHAPGFPVPPANTEVTHVTDSQGRLIPIGWYRLMMDMQRQTAAYHANQSLS